MATRTATINPFTADARVEAWLEHFGVQWDGPVDIPMAEFNIKDSKRNQARDTAIVADAVDMYVLSMTKGDKFPACVVFHTVNGYVFIDGVNRHAAAVKYGATHIRCYVISNNAGSEIIAAMTVSANVLNGASVKKEWRVIQAEALHSSQGFSLERACELLSVRQSDVRQYQKLLAANDNAARCGISMRMWEELSTTSRLELHSIGNLVVFEAASKLVLKYNVGAGTPIRDFVRKIREHLRTSQDDALEYIGEYAQFAEKAFIVAKNQGRKRSSSPQIGFITGLGKIQHTDPEKLRRAFITDEDREVMATRIEDSIRHLTVLLREFRDRKQVTGQLLEIASEVERG